MLRMIVIAAAVLLGLGGVTYALSRPSVADPGAPVFLVASPGADATPRPAVIPTPRHADDRDDARDDDDAPGGDARVGRDDDEDAFKVVAPKAVKADGGDWDDDADDDGPEPDDRDDGPDDGDDRDEEREDGAD